MIDHAAIRRLNFKSNALRFGWPELKRAAGRERRT